jgi:hypothetical protein
MKHYHCFLLNLVLFLVINCTITFSQDQTERKNNIYINSEPSGADIYINNKYVGLTPLTVHNQPIGKVKLLIKLDENNIYSEIMYYDGEEIEIFPLFNTNHSKIKIVTSPQNAAIILNDSLIGYTTNSSEFDIPLGPNKIKIEKDNYLGIEKNIYTQKKKYNWNIELKYRYAYLDIQNKPNEVKLEVDGISYDNSATLNKRIPVGVIKFKADYNEDKIVSRMFEINSNKNYKIEYKINYFTLTHIFESGILPGFGQFKDGSELKGIGIFLATATVGTMFIIQSKNYNYNLSEFNKAKKYYESANNENLASKYRSILENTYNKTEDSRKNKNLLLGVLIGTYLLNLIDASIFHTEGFDIDLLEIKDNLQEFNSTFININVPIN